MGGKKQQLASCEAFNLTRRESKEKRGGARGTRGQPRGLAIFAHNSIHGPPAASARGLLSLRRRLSDLEYHHPVNTVAMAPKKQVTRAPQENISLGPQVREGKKHRHPTIRDKRPLRRTIFAGGNARKKWLTGMNHRRARLWRCPHLRLLQRHLRPRHRSLVRLNHQHHPPKFCDPKGRGNSAIGAK